MSPEGPELYADDDISLKERLQRAEAVSTHTHTHIHIPHTHTPHPQYIRTFTPSQARDALSAENSELLAKLAEANAKIHQLQSHIAVIRQHTIGFILEQMNTLNPTMSTPGTEV